MMPRMKNEYGTDPQIILGALSAGLIIATPTECVDIEMWLRYHEGRVQKRYCTIEEWVECRDIVCSDLENKPWRIVN